jgi:hypothetical protein
MLARMGAGALTISALNSGLALATIGMALPAGPIVDRQRHSRPLERAPLLRAPRLLRADRHRRLPAARLGADRHRDHLVRLRDPSP